MTALPTRRDEAYRYADLKALAPLWPIAVEPIHVAAAECGALTIIVNGNQPTARHLAITLDAGATFDMRVLNTGTAYGRIAVNVTLGEGTQFHLGAAQLGGGEQTLELVTEVTHVAPNAVSRQVVRSVLGGRATGTYLGKVAVARGEMAPMPVSRCARCCSIAPQPPTPSPNSKFTPMT